MIFVNTLIQRKNLDRKMERYCQLFEKQKKIDKEEQAVNILYL